jgi:hypothetical protein
LQVSRRAPFCFHMIVILIFLTTAQVLQQTDQGTLQPWYTILMVIWNTFFIENWKQKQAYFAMYWGVDGFEQIEHARTNYEGVKIKSPVDNKLITYFPEERKRRRKAVVMTVLALMLILVLMIVAGIYVIEERVFGVSKTVQDAINLGEGFDGVVFLTAVAQAISIIILDNSLLRFMIPLNDYENHRTQTEYEDNLVFKVFMFKVVNNYAALIYVAFLKQFISGYYCNQNSCVLDLADTLRVIFLFNLLSNAFNEIFVRLVSHFFAVYLLVVLTLLL